MKIIDVPEKEPDKWYVYVILCDDNSLYKGFTNDLEKRYSQHINGTGANHTKIHKPTGLVYYEMFDDENSAILREKYFKSGSGREWLKNKLAGDK